jgi:hypothetical protein
VSFYCSLIVEATTRGGYMPALVDLCNNKKFGNSQKKYFWRKVEEIRLQEGGAKVKALGCLVEVWKGYDMGGHSYGRSLRSFLLEFIISSIEKNEDKDTEKIKLTLSILIAMYFDYKYINEHGWFDYKLENHCELPLKERILLCSAGFLLEVDDIPDIDYWPVENIEKLLKS